MVTKQAVQRQVRERSESIRLASMRFRKTQSRIIPFSQLPDACFMFETDSDLESFLRRNNLRAALESYLAAKNVTV